jgi:hypothetical protein
MAVFIFAGQNSYMLKAPILGKLQHVFFVGAKVSTITIEAN